MVFQNAEQANRAVSVLLSAMPGTSTLWTPRGPTEKARELIDADGGPLPSNERALLLAAWTLFGGRAARRFSDLLDSLSGEPLCRLFALVLAIDAGASAVDRWLVGAERWTTQDLPA